MSAALVTGLALEVPLAAQQPFAILDGTPVRLRLNRNLSSADSKVGESVDFELLEDLMVNDVVVAKRGSVALATVTEAQPKRRMGRAGKLNVNIDHLRLIDGEKVALRAVKETQGGGNSGKMTGAIVATSILFFPAAPLFLFMKGKDITIPKGTEITAYVNGEIALKPEKFVQAPSAPAGAVPATAAAAPAASQAGKPLTNSDVIQLKRLDFGDDLIIAKIKSSPGDYRLDTEDLIALKNAKLSDAVIQAMLGASKK